MSQNRHETFHKNAYGGPLQRTLTNMLKRELVSNFGYQDKLAIADLLIKRFLEIIDLYAPLKETVKPGQMVYLAVDVEDRPGRNKTTAQTKLKPVVVTVICEEDLLRLRQGIHPRKLLPEIIARICLEAFDQGGVLSQYDLALITGRCLSYIGKAIKQWQTEHGKSLPSRGTIHDLGSATTHKKEIVELYLQGYKTSEIALKTGHHPVNVDRYIKDFKRVLMLSKDKLPGYQIAFYTKMSEPLVREYLSIIQENQLFPANSAAPDKEEQTS